LKKPREELATNTKTHADVPETYFTTRAATVGKIGNLESARD
jgi:hypothetical protein